MKSAGRTTSRNSAKRFSNTDCAMTLPSHALTGIRPRRCATSVSIAVKPALRLAAMSRYDSSTRCYAGSRSGGFSRRLSSASKWHPSIRAFRELIL